MNSKSFFAFLLPSSLNFFNFASPTCKTAISAQEKNPFTSINTNKSTTLPSITLLYSSLNFSFILKTLLENYKDFIQREKGIVTIHYTFSSIFSIKTVLYLLARVGVSVFPSPSSSMTVPFPRCLCIITGLYGNFPALSNFPSPNSSAYFFRL